MANYKVVVVDGIIGAGKTCLIKECLAPHLRKKGLKVTIVKEPVEKWKKDGSLEQFYSEPKKRGYQFQTRVFHDRVQETRYQYFKSEKDTDIFLLERSIFTDVLFMKMMHQTGIVDDSEYRDYMMLWTMWSDLMPFTPDLFIYLRPSISATMNRLRERNRKEETTITEEYQISLQKEHDMRFITDSIGVGNKIAKCIQIRSDENFRDNENVKNRIGSQILNIINII